MGETSNNSEPLVASMAMFGAVAMMVTRWHRQQSSAEDLGGSGFDENEAELEKFVQSIPKIELHVHLDGSFDPIQLWEHLQSNPKVLEKYPIEKEFPWKKDDEPPMKLRYVENVLFF